MTRVTIPALVRRLAVARRHLSGFTFAMLALVLFATALMSIKPANTLWSEDLKLSVELTTAELPLQGCSPGYWKTHPESWDGLAPDYTQQVQHSDKFKDWFGSIPATFDTNDTLLEVTQTGGGGLVALARHAAAHLATAEAHELGHIPGYPYTKADVINLYKAAVAASTETAYDNATEQLEATEVDCPLGNLSRARTFSSSALETAGTLTAFEEWAGIGPLPPIPVECKHITFTKVYVMQSAGTYLSGIGNDLIFGSSGDDVIAGRDGHDCIVGGGGNDEIDAGAGNDIVFGGAGQDRLTGGLGDDYLIGDDGNDKLWGNAGDNALDGGAGADKCSGEAGANTYAACEQAAGPTGLKATYDASTADVTLTWTSVPSSTGYVVYVSENGGAWTTLDTPASAGFIHRDVDAGRTYTYSVAYLDAEGFLSSSSAVVTLTIAGPTPTPTPTRTTIPQPTRTPSPSATPIPTVTSTPTATPTPAGGN